MKTSVTIHKAGDFYEVRGQPARVLAKNFHLTRQKRQGEDMVGVPYRRLDELKAQLLESGYTIEMKNPRKRRGKATKKSRAFVSKEIKKLRRRGYQPKRAVAAALDVARRKGYKMPARKKNPAGRPLTAPSKHCIIAALQRSTGDVGFFDGARLQNDPKKAILYPSRLVAMQTAKGLPHPKGITYIVAQAGYTRDQYLREMTGVKRNPLSREEVSRAAGRFERFTGHRATKVDEVDLKIPKTGYLLGPVSDISYVATRDGETSVYRHTFKARSRPSLVAASDGSSMVIAGGRYRVTADRGIVDK